MLSATFFNLHIPVQSDTARVDIRHCVIGGFCASYGSRWAFGRSLVRVAINRLRDNRSNTYTLTHL